MTFDPQRWLTDKTYRLHMRAYCTEHSAKSSEFRAIIEGLRAELYRRKSNAKRLNCSTNEAPFALLKNRDKICVVCSKPFRAKHGNSLCCSYVCKDEKDRQWRAANADRINEKKREARRDPIKAAQTKKVRNATRRERWRTDEQYRDTELKRAKPRVARSHLKRAMLSVALRLDDPNYAEKQLARKEQLRAQAEYARSCRKRLSADERAEREVARKEQKRLAANTYYHKNKGRILRELANRYQHDAVYRAKVLETNRRYRERNYQ